MSIKSRLDKLTRKVGLRPEDLTIKRTFIGTDGTPGPTLEIIVSRQDMSKDQIEAANQKAREEWERECAALEDSNASR